MVLIKPPLGASLTNGTRRQKNSMLRYLGMYFSAIDIDMQSFGTDPTGTNSEIREAIRRECMVRAGFDSFVVMYPRKTKKAYNSTAHSERAVGTVRGYYEHMNGTGYGVDFTRILRGVSRCLCKLYPAAPLSRIPLLSDYMRSIRAVMRMDYLKDVT